MILRLLSTLSVSRRQKMSVLASSQTFINVSTEKCMFCNIKSITYSDIGKCLVLGVILPSGRIRSTSSCLCLCVFYSLVSVVKQVYRILFTILHPGGIETDVFPYFLLIHSAQTQSNFSESLFSPFESRRVYLL